MLMFYLIAQATVVIVVAWFLATMSVPLPPLVALIVSMIAVPLLSGPVASAWEWLRYRISIRALDRRAPILYALAARAAVHARRARQLRSPPRNRRQ